MTSRSVLALCSIFLSLVFLVGVPGRTQAQPPASAVAAATMASPAVVLAHWTDLLHDRARMMQGAFLCILLGMFILRWGGK